MLIRVRVAAAARGRRTASLRLLLVSTSGLLALHPTGVMAQNAGVQNTHHAGAGGAAGRAGDTGLPRRRRDPGHSTITLGAQFDGGIQGNGDRPADGLNYGRLFDDKANTAQLNQIQLTATRPISSSATGYDVGFTLQGTYGSDVRYLHYLGEFTNLTSDRYQLTLLQANLLVHAPWLTAGGIDFKIGQFVTPIGYETIDPSTNPFYSHSYIFNYGPFQHTGALGEWHVNPTLDVYGQIDTGESTTFGTGSGDNNGEPAGAVRPGTEQPARAASLPCSDWCIWDRRTRCAPTRRRTARCATRATLIATYKATDKLTLVTELNYQHDDGFGADSYAGAQYVSYALTPTVALNGRAEVYRDNAGFFVFSFPGNLDPVARAQGPLQRLVQRRARDLQRVHAGLHLQADGAEGRDPADPARDTLGQDAQRHPRLRRRHPDRQLHLRRRHRAGLLTAGLPPARASDRGARACLDAARMPGSPSGRPHERPPFPGRATPPPRAPRRSMAQWFALKARASRRAAVLPDGRFLRAVLRRCRRPASAALDIALTARGNHAGQPIADVRRPRGPRRRRLSSPG